MYVVEGKTIQIFLKFNYMQICIQNDRMAKAKTWEECLSVQLRESFTCGGNVLSLHLLNIHPADLNSLKEIHH